MDFYVQSCGVAQEHGYCWLDENQKIVEEPDLIKKVKNLIESEAPSVVLARDSDKLLLLVTGLKASHRTDYRGRTIRNSVAWVDEDTSENERTLRALAARALRGSLGEGIDCAVDSRKETGFEVSFKKIQELTATAKAKKQQLPLEREKKQIKPTSKEDKKELAEELEEYCLPKPKSDNQQVVPLVVVTGIQDKETLENAGVWRGMSSLVTKDKEGKQQPTHGNSAKNIFQWLFARVNIPIPRIGIPGVAIMLITVLYFAFQILPLQSRATIPSCFAITDESLIFYARQSEVVLGDESVIKVFYNPQEIKSLLLLDKDENHFNPTEDKTNNDGKRELTYRLRFESTGMHLVRLQGTNIAISQPICEQPIHINVLP
ncbi:hypothetical protein H6F98_00015 [Microcoleus sp. FACHB-SPT15]|uniref:hypothetical protein n=1 Tax=Microcoleus sp. FACHB-SPT15 TaxID=2692830 RepID=UPI0017824842|nr:hypothetical protein [Microcoleus sp. FACHB-SPT15]MBD1803863.1 hypothetical protein [Microcoleus sp. FACHB-SPT15]